MCLKQKFPNRDELKQKDDNISALIFFPPVRINFNNKLYK